MSDLTLLIPAKFEAECLPYFLKELKKFNYKKIVILDSAASYLLTLNTAKISFNIFKVLNYFIIIFCIKIRPQFLNKKNFTVCNLP